MVSTGVGSATLLVNAAGTQGTLNYSFTNLVGQASDQAIDADPYLTNGSQVLYDISVFKPQPNGSFLWNIKATGTLQTNDILEILAEGKAAIVIESSVFPNGEISGHFTLANGSQSFTPPPAPPAWTDDSANSNSAARFLEQATFGASPPDIATVQALGYAGWISNQFSVAGLRIILPVVLANMSPDPTEPFPSSLMFNTWWQRSVTAPDQLRQRVAFALSEIMVASENGVLANSYANGLSSYYDTLLDNSFGNFRNLLKAVTLHPVMGVYLNMQGNQKGSIITGVHANENYAREINQLFSIGLNRIVAGWFADIEFAEFDCADVHPASGQRLRPGIYGLDVVPDEPGQWPPADQFLPGFELHQPDGSCAHLPRYHPQTSAGQCGPATGARRGGQIPA